MSPVPGRRQSRGVTCGIAACLLAACGTSTLAYGQALPTLHEVDRDRSVLYVVTKRSGLLSFLGHDHAILAREWQGRICANDATLPEGYGSVTVQAASLEIDSDSARALASLGRGPSVEQRRTLQRVILDDSHLAAESFPTLSIDVTEIVAPNGRPSARGRVTIRDRTHDAEFPVELTRSDGALQVKGQLQLLQSEFGIRPESIAGVVKVADRVTIYFTLLAVDTRSPCH